MESKIDSNQKCYYPSIFSTSWLRVRLESIGSLIVFFTATFSVMKSNIVAVERLKEYCQAPQEAEWESVQKPP
ncbi:unnamed protein product, partial [Allacma fusca]